jgi:hypothetical protein
MRLLPYTIGTNFALWHIFAFWRVFFKTAEKEKKRKEKKEC